MAYSERNSGDKRYGKPRYENKTRGEDKPRFEKKFEKKSYGEDKPRFEKRERLEKPQRRPASAGSRDGCTCPATWTGP